jgi:glycosyltransferase involved in cell wall biosynthesis
VRVIEEAKFLSRNGCDVHLLGNVTNKNFINKVKDITCAEIHTFSYMTYLSSGILTVLGSLKYGWIYNPLLRRDIKKIVEDINPDIIQCEFLHSANQALMISKELKIPVVLTEHNVEYIIQSSVGLARKDELKDIERDICNEVDYVIAVSDNDAREFRKIGVTNKIKVIQNGIDYDRYNVDNRVRYAMREKYGISKDDVVLIYHGSLKYKPNVIANKLLKQKIFPALRKKHGNIKLLLIGRGHRNSVNNGVIEVSEVPFEDLPGYLSMGDIGVIPLTMGSGTRLKIIEYLALGIPTVSTLIGAEGLPITDHEHMLLTGDTDDGFVSKVELLLNDAMLREKLRKSGKELVRSELDWNNVFKNYPEIYNAVL